MAVAGTGPALVGFEPNSADRRRVLSVACCAHALHDGYTDLIYVLLPVWQTEFALSYAALGALRVYVSRLRALLPPLEDGERLFYRAPGYALAVADGELDATAAVEVERHLESCADCALLLAELEETRRGPKGSK